jgi:hypothetical protein
MVLDIIRSLILPPRIGRYAFKRLMIGTFELTNDGIYMTLVRAYHHYREIVQARIVPIVAVSNNLSTQQDRVFQTFKELIAEIGRLDEVYVVLASNMVVIKELTVPFVDAEKIELIAPFEVEPLLPFAISDAVTTTLVMSSDHERKESKVLVCAVNKSYLQELYTFMQSLSVPLQGISVAVVELAALYRSIPDYQTSLTGATIVMHVHEFMTEYLVYDASQQLVHVRVGMVGYNHARFFDDVTMMLEHASQLTGVSIERVLVIPDTPDTVAWMKNFNDTLHLTAQLMQSRLITHYPKVTAASGVTLDGSLSDVITPALHVPASASFSFLVGPFKLDQSSLLVRQLITSVLLILGGLTALITSTSLVRSAYASEAQNSQNQVRTLLIKELNMPDQAKRLPLSKLNDQAINKVKAEQDIWLSLSAEHRASILHYLEELSRRLDLQKLGLNVTHIAINDTLQTLLFEGSVRDFEALHILQDELERVPYFEYVPRAQDTKFSLKITLKPTLE